MSWTSGTVLQNMDAGDHVWELHKENVQPLRQGRKMDQLEDVLTKDFAARQRALDQAKEQFEQQIAEEAPESDDPLSYYLSYIEWAEQSYASGSRSVLQDILERTIRAFQSNTTDIRCLKIYIKYVELLHDHDKLQVFDMLRQKGAFMSHALLYESWACVLEGQGSVKQARTVYENGITQKAQPLARLERHYQEFLQRVATGVMQGMANQQMPSQQQQQRRPLGDLSKKAGVMRTGPATVRSRGGLPGRGGEGRQQGNVVVVPLDENCQPTATDAANGEDAVDGGQLPSGVLPAHKESTKENVTKADVWNKKTKKAATALTVSLKSVKSSVPVFIDQDNDAVAVPPVAMSLPPSSVLCSSKLKQGTTASAVAALSKPEPPRQITMYPKSQVYTDHGEFSLEEIRAVEYLQRYKAEEDGADGNAMDLTEVCQRTIVLGGGFLKDLTDRRERRKSELTITRQLTFASPGSGVTSVEDSTMRQFVRTAVNENISTQQPKMEAGMCVAESSTPFDQWHRQVWDQRQTGLIGGDVQPFRDTPTPTIERSMTHVQLGPHVTPTMTLNTRYAHQAMMDAFNTSLTNGDAPEDGSLPKTSAATLAVSSRPLSAAHVDFVSATQPVAMWPSSSSSIVPFDETAEPPVDQENSCQVAKAKMRGGGLSVRSAPAAVRGSCQLSEPARSDGGTGLSAIALAHHLNDFHMDTDRPVKAGDEASIGVFDRSQCLSEHCHYPISSTPAHSKSMHFAPPGTFSTMERKCAPEEETPCATAPRVCSEKSSDESAPRHNHLSPIEEEGSSANSSSSTSGSHCSVTMLAIGPSLATTTEEQMDTTDSQSLPVFDKDPFDSSVTAAWIAESRLQLQQCTGFVDLSTTDMPEMSVGRAVCLNPSTDAFFLVNKQLGNGAFATVYSISRDSNECDSSEGSLAVKAGQVDIWEFFVVSQLRARLEASNRHDILSYVMHVQYGILYRDGVCLVSDEHSSTLLDVVNHYKQLDQTSVPEPLVLFFTWHLLRAVSGMHAMQVLHGDIKPDNVVITTKFLRLCGQLGKLKSSLSDADAQRFLQSIVPIQVIDFGRAIDLSRLPDGTVFTSSSDTEAFMCHEMLNNQPWRYQVDTHGLISTVHVLLCGDYMRLTQSKGTGLWKPTKPPKRYWSPIWPELYSTLLNVPLSVEPPNFDGLCMKVETQMLERSYLGPIYDALADQIARL